MFISYVLFRYSNGYVSAFLIDICPVNHDIENFSIGRTHTDTSDITHTFDCFFNIILDDTLTRKKALVLYTELKGPIRAASTEEAILAAQEGFAPSQTMPPTFPSVLIIVRDTC